MLQEMVRATEAPLCLTPCWFTLQSVWSVVNIAEYHGGCMCGYIGDVTCNGHVTEAVFRM